MRSYASAYKMCVATFPSRLNRTARSRRAGPRARRPPDQLAWQTSSRSAREGGVSSYNLRAGFTRNSNGQPDSPNRVEDTHGLLLARILKGGEEISPLWVICPDDWITGDVAVTRGENVLLVRQPTTTEGEELFLRIIVNYRGAFTKGHETSVCWKFCFGEHMFLQYGGNEYNYER
jgi:hypothetical protein